MKNSNPVLGNFGIGTAILYDTNEKCIATCIDTPNGIAKAFMELPKARFVSQCLSKELEPVSKYKSRMQDWNEAKSMLKESL